MLRLDQVESGFGALKVLRGVSFEVAAGEVFCLLGRNGAGKTSTLKTIMGLMRVTAGSIHLGDECVSILPAFAVPRRGIGYVPQGRRLFAELTVAENLQIGLMTRDSDATVLDKVLTLFPLLRDRLPQRSGTLSGGEQQMLAMARALCLRPRVLLLDEPTEGLMPSMIARIQEAVLELKSEGVAIVLVEQRVDAALAVADRVGFLENGRLMAVVNRAEIAADTALLQRYVGVDVVTTKPHP